MSGLRTSFSVPDISPFFSFRAAQSAGRQSATAAVMTRQTGRPAGEDTRTRWTAASMSRAETTSTRVTPLGVLSATGPAMSVTSWPARRAARATAKPIRPVEGLERKRTGSRYSRVGPAVTMKCSFRFMPDLTDLHVSAPPRKTFVRASTPPPRRAAPDPQSTPLPPDDDGSRSTIQVCVGNR